MTGWVRVSRAIFEHELFANEPMSEREAWLWLVAKAAWKDTRHRVGNAVHDVHRGSLFTTLRDLQLAWRWQSDYRVRTFLDMLKNERMIERTANAGKTHVSICNYSKYQDAERTENVEINDHPTHGQRTANALKEQDNKITKERTLSGGRADTPQTKPDRFEDFWQAYPKRDGANPKEPARKRFVAAIKSGVDPDSIIAGAKAYTAAEAKRGNVGSPYIAQAVTWLNQRRWTDAVEQAPATGPPDNPAPSGWRPGLPTDAELRAKYARLRNPEPDEDDYAPRH